MKLVEAAVYRYLLDNGITEPIYVGVADAESEFPLVLIQRVDTGTIHTKDMSAEGEDITIQVSSASNVSMLSANTLNDTIDTLLNNLKNENVTIEVGNELMIYTIFKEDDRYIYDEENDVHYIHTDYIVSV